MATRIHPAGVQSMENAEFPMLGSCQLGTIVGVICHTRGGIQPQMESCAVFFFLLGSIKSFIW